MAEMDDQTFQKVVRVRISEAIDYIDSDIAKDRERATRYYFGDVADDLPSVAGRSSVVSRDLRDTVRAVMPSLMRVFAGQEKVVQFEPVSQEDEAGAEQATDYANYILRNDNPGFLILYSAIKDALVRRCGLIKVWWDRQDRVTAKRFDGIDDETFGLFMAEAESTPDVEVLDHTQEEPDKHAFTVKRVTRKGRVCVEAMPPEEFIISRDAKNMADAAITGHRSIKRVGDLVAMGYDFEEMVELSGDDTLSLNEEKDARNPYTLDEDDQADDPSMRPILYVEAYIRCDKDGDGIPELLKVCTAGESYRVLMSEIVSDNPFCDLCPDPEPHTFFGQGYFEILSDIQLIRTQLLRLGLDALGQVVTPRLEIGPGVNIKQVLDNRIGGVVQSSQPGQSIFPIQTDKAAPTMAMQAYRDIGELRSERTGQNQASMGLESDALQSTSRIAASALVQQAQSAIEMIARIFAETGFRRMYRLILDLTTRYQDKERVIRLRNAWVPMDPRTWTPDMDVTVNVGLGTGNTEERAMFMQGVLQMQQGIMQQAGPDNPWVDAEKVRNALEDMCEVGGKLPSRYFLTSDEWTQKQQQQAQQPPKPEKQDPAQMIAQVEAQKIQADMQNSREKLQFDAQREMAKDDRERDYNEARIIIDATKAGVDPMYVLGIMRQARQPGVMQ